MKRPRVSARSMVCVTAKPKSYIINLNSPQEMASHGAALLVEELGTQSAKLFLREEFAKCLPDYRGYGRDTRQARIDVPDVRQAGDNANTHPSPAAE